MRVLLFTGKGGVGTTTVAAATAWHAAACGSKTLLLSLGRSRSLGDAVGLRLGPQATELDTGLYALQVDAQDALQVLWSQAHESLAPVLGRAGVEQLHAAEMTVVPGAEQLLALAELARQIGSGPWDLVVVDCGPAAAALPLLALPEALCWYLDRAFPPQHRALRTARPLLDQLVGGAPGVPGPLAAQLLDVADRWQCELQTVVAVLRHPGTSVRLVLTPEDLAVAEARRTLSALALQQLPLDAVIANRVLPASVDPLLDGWARQQQVQLARVRELVGDVEVHESPQRPEPPVGPSHLGRLGRALPAVGEPVPARPAAWTTTRTRAGYDLSMPLPHVRLADLELGRSGDDLVLTVDGLRRRVPLPSLLRRCAVVGARLRAGALVVGFEPDPELWPTETFAREGA